MIYLRGSKFYFRRRVPKRFERVADSGFVHVSLATDSLELAQSKAVLLWQEMLEGWEASLDGLSDEAAARFEAARDIAKRRGFRYRPNQVIADMPLDQILSRVEAVPPAGGGPSIPDGAALLGAVRPPEMTISAALEAYWPLARDKTLGKSEDQIRRWRNPIIKAIGNLIEVLGDIEISQITGDDMQDFREWWIDRIEAEGLTPNSANKDFTFVSVVLKRVASAKRLGFEPPVGGLRIAEGRQRTRLPFSTDFIRDKIIGGLGGLNDEARSVVLVMINTGMRPSEIVGLMPEHIKLDAGIPHVRVRPVGRTLKTRSSERDIPLVGVSLEGILPGGTPRYRDGAGVSALVNKYLRNNGLAETDEHTLYGLRHSFEDRLLVAGVDERVRRDLMGHSLGRERYGLGGGLPERLKAVQTIAL